MIDLIIFSKNRACQSEALLHSIKTYTNNLFKVYLLTIADGLWLDGYKLIQDYDFTFVKRYTILKPDLMLLLSKTNSKYICFAVDDNIIFNHIQDFDMSNVFTFSFRLGYNTLVQDHFLNTYQVPLSFEKVEKNTISWDFRRFNPHSNYGYWNSLDFHVFRRKDIIPLLESINFKQPNELENNLFYKRDQVHPTFIRSHKQSSTVSVPLNNLSGMTKSIGPSLEELNNRFLNGEKLRFKTNKNDIVGCHQNLEFCYV